MRVISRFYLFLLYTVFGTRLYEEPNKEVASCAFSCYFILTKISNRDLFGLIYNNSMFNLNILRNIMKTAQDSQTIFIKQSVSFQGGFPKPLTLYIVSLDMKRSIQIHHLISKGTI